MNDGRLKMTTYTVFDTRTLRALESGLTEEEAEQVRADNLYVIEVIEIMRRLEPGSSGRESGANSITFGVCTDAAWRVMTGQ